MTLPDPPTTAQRVAFLGTPEIAVPALQALLDGGFDVPIVVTGPDRRRGRGRSVSFTPVKQLATEHDLTVASEVDAILEHDVDLGVVVAFGQIIRANVLERVPLVNLHFSELPRWRGAAPVERAILAGDSTIGVAVMQIAAGLDEGDIFAETIVEIDEGESAADLKRRLSHLGAALLVDTVHAGFPDRRPQQGEPLYAAKIATEDRHLDWTMSADQLARIVRIGDAWTTFRGKRLKVHEVQRHELADGDRPLGPGVLEAERVGTGSGVLQLTLVQPEGRARMRATDWSRGARSDGERFDR